MESKSRICQHIWSTKRYFKTRQFFGSGHELWVSAGILAHVFKIPIKTIRNGVSNFKCRKSTLWRSYFSDLAIFVNWSTIPAKSVNRYNLPTSIDEVIHLLTAEQGFEMEEFHSFELEDMRARLLDAYSRQYPAFIKFYVDDFPSPEDRVHYARSHSLLESVLWYKQQKFPRAAIFEAYRAVVVKALDEDRSPILNLCNAQYFWRKIKEAEVSIKDALIHLSKGVSKDYKVKLTGPIKAHIRNLLRSEKGYSYAHIVESVKKNYHVEIHVSNIKNMMRDRLLRNDVKFFSKGYSHSKNKSLPKVRRELAFAPGELYYGDFYYLPFVVKNHAGKPFRPWGYFILDVFSKKYVGWSVGDEDKLEAASALCAFQMAFYDCGFMAAEIHIDKDRIYRDKAFKTFRRATSNMGVIWDDGVAGYPGWRADVESGLSILQKKIFTKKDSYVGPNITSSSSTRKPSKDLVNKYWNGKSNVLYLTEFRTEFDKWMIEYNNLPYSDFRETRAKFRKEENKKRG